MIHTFKGGKLEFQEKNYKTIKANTKCSGWGKGQFRPHKCPTDCSNKYEFTIQVTKVRVKKPPFRNNSDNNETDSRYWNHEREDYEITILSMFK